MVFAQVRPSSPYFIITSMITRSTGCARQKAIAERFGSYYDANAITSYLNSEKGFLFFQKFIKENGIVDEMKRLGIQEGDTVRIYGHYFDYYE